MRGQAHLAEQALGAATGEIKHRFGISRGLLRVADDRHIVAVFNVQQGSRGFVGQALGHFFIHEVNHLRLQRRGTDRGWGMLGLVVGQGGEQAMGHALRLHAQTGELVPQLNGLRVDRSHQPRLECRRGSETLPTHFAQQVAHVHGDITKVDFHRARCGALVAHGAMVGHVFKLFPVLDGDAAAGLLFVQKGFNQQGGGQNFVAWAVEQIGSRHMGGAHRFAFAATQTVFDGVGNGTNVRLFHDERLVAHQAKAGRVSAAQIGVFQQLAFVEPTLGVDAGFVVGKGLHLLRREVFQLGDANPVLAGDDAIQRTRQSHDAVHRFVRGLQHLVVVTVDRQIGVHIAVTRVHVQRGPDPSFQDALVHRIELLAQGRKRGAAEQIVQLRAQLGFPAGTKFMRLQLQQQCFNIAEPTQPQTAHFGNVGTGLVDALLQQLWRGCVGVVFGRTQGQTFTRQQIVERIAQRNFVAQGEFNVDALNTVGVLGHARQGNDHVFIDFEGVGVAADGRRAFAVEPKLLAGFGADSDETFA